MLGDAIKKIRESKHLGLNETARLAGISGSYLSNIEKGIRENPSIESLQKIADALGVSVNEFFDDENNESANKENTIIDDINKVVEKNKIETIAAHLDAKEFTEEDLRDIEQFIKFVAERKKNRE